MPATSLATLATLVSLAGTPGYSNDILRVFRPHELATASSLALLLLESMIFLWDGSGRIRERICENIDLQPVANKISSWASDWHFVKKLQKYAK